MDRSQHTFPKDGDKCPRCISITRKNRYGADQNIGVIQMQNPPLGAEIKFKCTKCNWSITMPLESWQSQYESST